MTTWCEDKSQVLFCVASSRYCTVCSEGAAFRRLVSIPSLCLAPALFSLSLSHSYLSNISVDGSPAKTVCSSSFKAGIGDTVSSRDEALSALTPHMTNEC
jgi:hypothetical protein